MLRTWLRVSHGLLIQNIWMVPRSTFARWRNGNCAGTASCSGTRVILSGKRSEPLGNLSDSSGEGDGNRKIWVTSRCHRPKPFPEDSMPDLIAGTVKITKAVWEPFWGKVSV